MTTNKDASGAPTAPAQERPHDSDGPPPPHSGRRGPAHKSRTFEGPVAWLLGRQLLRSTKGILLFAAFGRKLDPRDWMTATVHTFVADAKGEWKHESSAEAPGQSKNESPAAGQGESKEDVPAAEEPHSPSEFWFDYIADTGDGMRATYSIAYLCLSDLAVPTLNAPGEKRDDPGAPVLKAGDSALPIDLNRPRPDAVLPRGEFLFVGGDTAYHASDYTTLAQRVQETFNWAFKDATKDGRINEKEPPRPIFGIPGNHDYYDQLDGFRRQFHRPALWEPRPGEEACAGRGYRELVETAQLSLRGFYRAQGASYVALRLPFGWRMWGLDTETGQIDERQKSFFRQFCRTASSTGDPRPDIVIPPKRLIVATCSPTTVFGKLADPEDFKAADAFGQLGIEQPFLPGNVEEACKLGRRLGIPYDLTETGDRRLKTGQCRLDLSGDVHHYARYWGPEPPDRSLTPRPGEDERFERLEPDAGKREALKRKNRPRSHSYASVVSGIGGAFHHPSQTYYGHVREQSLYPSEKTSTREVSRLLFKFWNIFAGGYVWLAGALLAFLVCFAFAVPQSSRDVLNNLPHFGFGLATQERIDQIVRRVPEGGAARKASDCEDPACVKPFWYTVAGVGDLWRSPANCGETVPHYFFGPCNAGKWPPKDFIIGLVMAALLSWIPLAYATFSKKLYVVAPKKKGDKDEGGDSPSERAYPDATPGPYVDPSELADTPEGNKIRPAGHHPEAEAEPAPRLWLSTVVAALLFFLGLAMVKPYRSHITPFGSSLLVFLSIVWAGLCVALNLRYTEFLFMKTQVRTIRKRDWALTWVLGGLSVLALAHGLWSFGRNNLPALVVSDMVFTGALLALFGGLVIAFPLYIKKALFPRRPAAARAAAGVAIGLWHFVLQLAVPFVLVRKPSLLTLAVVVLVIVAGMVIGERLLARFKGGALALAWVVLGVLTIALPVWLVRPDGWWPARQWLAPDDWTGWLGLVPSLLAAAVGAVMCCYWFGWYLGVCFAFNAHNNEVGGAARIERFKQFIRFRLTEEGLTGYVIAVNDPSDKGSDLTPHVVDVFRLVPNYSVETGRDVPIDPPLRLRRSPVRDVPEGTGTRL